MTNLGTLDYFLTLQIWHMANGSFLSQLRNVTNLLAHFHMSDYKPSPTPFKSGVKLIFDFTTPLVNATLYRHLSRSLIYLTHNKLDLSFLVSMVSRFMQKPCESHWQTTKIIL